MPFTLISAKVSTPSPTIFFYPSRLLQNVWTTIQETNWLSGGPERVVANELNSTWTPATNRVTQGSILEHNLFTTFAKMI